MDISPFKRWTQRFCDAERAGSPGLGEAGHLNQALPRGRAAEHAAQILKGKNAFVTANANVSATPRMLNQKGED